MDVKEKYTMDVTEEKTSKKSSKSKGVLVAVLAAVIAILAVSYTPVKKAIGMSKMYKEAVALVESGNYSEAIKPLKELGGYKNCKELYATAFEGVREEVKKYDGIIDAGIAVLGRKADGTVIAADGGYGRGEVYSWTDVEYVSTNGMSLGLKKDGTIVVSGGYNYHPWYGYTQFDFSEWKDVVNVDAGSEHVIALKSDGTVLAAGRNDYGECDVSDWNDIIAVSAGVEFSLGLKSDGTVVSTGRNDYGQCQVFDWTDIVEISAGQYHSVGLKSDGTVVAVGDTADKKCDVYDWTDIVKISADYNATVGLKADGTVVCATFLLGYDTSSWTDVVSVSAGQNGIVGLKRDGTIYAVGQNFEGMETVRQWDLF